MSVSTSQNVSQKREMNVMSNKTYDVLKWICLVVLPAITTLWLALAAVWNFPMAEQVGATLTAVTAFMGTILGVSAVKYNKSLKETKK